MTTGNSNTTTSSAPVPELIATYRGHDIYFLHISYYCASLALYGYGSDDELKRAIDSRLTR